MTASNPDLPTQLELLGDRDLLITRAFHAPRALVFRAWTTPELVRRWWAPASRGATMSGCEITGGVGGRYRYALNTGAGREVVFSGTYQEFSPPDRLVSLEIFEDFPDAPVLITVDFTERDGVTTVRSHERYPSAEARAGAFSSGMEEGMRETLEQLAGLLAALQA